METNEGVVTKEVTAINVVADKRATVEETAVAETATVKVVTTVGATTTREVALELNRCPLK